jgi:hypothetical protein
LTAGTHLKICIDAWLTKKRETRSCNTKNFPRTTAGKAESQVYHAFAGNFYGKCRRETLPEAPSGVHWTGAGQINSIPIKKIGKYDEKVRRVRVSMELIGRQLSG